MEFFPNNSCRVSRRRTNPYRRMSELKSINASDMMFLQPNERIPAIVPFP